MKKSFILFCLLFITMGVFPVSAGDAFTKDMEAFREIYIKASDGDKSAVRKAIRAVRKLEGKYRKHPLVMVYKGGTLTLRGIAAGNRPLDRVRETEEGLNVIDRALRMLPRHKGDELERLEARLVAAFVFINIPNSIFHRLNQGQHLVDQLLTYPKFDDLPKGMQAAIYYAAALSAEKHQDPIHYRRYLEMTVETDPEGLNGQEARRLLKDITG